MTNGASNVSKAAGARYTTMTCSYRNVLGTCGPFSVQYHYTIDADLKDIHRRNVSGCYLTNADPYSDLRSPLSNSMTSKKNKQIRCNVPIKLSMYGYLFGYVSLNSSSNGYANLTEAACWSLTNQG